MGDGDAARAETRNGGIGRSLEDRQGSAIPRAISGGRAHDHETIKSVGINRARSFFASMLACGVTGELWLACRKRRDCDEAGLRRVKPRGLRDRVRTVAIGAQKRRAIARLDETRDMHDRAGPGGEPFERARIFKAARHDIKGDAAPEFVLRFTAHEDAYLRALVCERRHEM